MKKFTLLLTAAALSAGVAFAQEEQAAAATDAAAETAAAATDAAAGAAQQTQQITQEQLQALLAQMQQNAPAPAKIEDIKAMLPEVIGTVRGENFTRDELLKALEENPNALAMLGRVEGADRAQMLKDMADELMTMDLLEKIADEKGLLPKDAAAAKAALQEEINAMPEEMKAAFEEQLKAQGSTLDKFLDEWSNKEEIRLNLALDKLMKQMTSEANVNTDEAAKKYYDENIKDFTLDGTELAASHILITPEADTPEADEAAKKAAEDVIKRIQAGENFEDIAKELSACPSKAQGGDLGYFRAEQMVPEFSAAVVMAEEGKLIETPVKTQFGYHVIRRNALPKAVPFEKVKDAIKNQLAAKFMQSYVESLQKSDIVNNITVPAEEAAPAETAAPAEAK